MSSFVQQKLEELKREDDSVRSNREWLLHVDKMFQAKVPLLWKQLFACVESQVNEWNNGLGRPNHPHRIEFQAVSPSGILARRVTFPTVRVFAQLDKDDQSIRFDVRRKVDHETPESLWHGRLRIELCEGDNELHFYDCEQILPECTDAAEVILEPLFSGKRKILA